MFLRNILLPSLGLKIDVFRKDIIFWIMVSCSLLGKYERLGKLGDLSSG
jgi:hypothetical protein